MTDRFQLVAPYQPSGDQPQAIARLAEMGLEPYQLTSSIFGIVAQRLVRRLNPTAPPTCTPSRVSASAPSASAPMSRSAPAICTLAIRS